MARVAFKIHPSQNQVIPNKISHHSISVFGSSLKIFTLWPCHFTLKSICLKAKRRIMKTQIPIYFTMQKYNLQKIL